MAGKLKKAVRGVKAKAKKASASLASAFDVKTPGPAGDAAGDAAEAARGAEAKSDPMAALAAQIDKLAAKVCDSIHPSLAANLRGRLAEYGNDAAGLVEKLRAIRFAL
jgi:hypothetical protein